MNRKGEGKKKDRRVLYEQQLLPSLLKPYENYFLRITRLYIRSCLEARMFCLCN